MCKSDLITEVHTEFSQPWIKQVTRVISGQPYLEIEYTVGPIPIKDLKGKEVVTRFRTAIQNDGVFYTDSNGREFMKRKRSYRPTWTLQEFQPVSGNYYPVNAAIYIEDEDSSLSLLVDRSQGGSSLSDGTVELMVQRRTVVDDGRGVGEPMNETDRGMTPYPPYGDATRLGEGIIIRGTHRVMIGSGWKGASIARSQMDKAFSNPHIFAASAASDAGVTFHRTKFSALQTTLPSNIMLITFAKISADNFLIRLGHQYAKNEDDDLSKAVQVDLSKLFAGYSIMSVVEKTLSGNQDRSEWEKRRLHWTDVTEEMGSERSIGDDFVFQLNPMEIRTFEVVAKVEKESKVKDS